MRFLPIRIFRLLLAAAVLCFNDAPQAQTRQNVLADVGGFENDGLYPLGSLRSVSDGQMRWSPAGSSPGQIVEVDPGSPHGRVLRPAQTGVDNLDTLSFPPVSQGMLALEFDSRASTSGTRTLDVFVLPTSGGEVSLVGWGMVSNCALDREPMDHFGRVPLGPQLRYGEPRTLFQCYSP